MRRLILTAGLLLVASGPAAAQVARDNAEDAGAGIRAGHVTSTGETVPNPGASQSGGTTSMDKGIQQRDNSIDTSICKGC